jgi:D-tyrosyl-tRNA(Tyr) deacylase
VRAVAQRVTAAHVDVERETVGRIGPGLLVYLGVGKDDTLDDVRWMASKLASLRIFADDAGKMSRNVEQVSGEVLVVSQFTLYGDMRRGNRPSFDAAAPPEPARELVDAVCSALRERGLTVATGRFGASMQVHANVDGPVTILLEGRGGNSG